MKNNKLIVYLFILIICITVVSALEANSTNFKTNSYFGFALTTDTIVGKNTSIGLGQIIISNNSYTTYSLCEGIFCILNLTSAAPCSSSYLSACMNSGDCISAGGYWYSGLCWATPAPGGGGSTPGSGTTPPRYAIYPLYQYDTINHNGVKLKSFTIENLEYSYPLTIEITTDLDIYSKRFDIAPSRIQTIYFTVDGFNKTGYYNDTITVKIIKTPTTYRIETVTISYYVREGTIIDVLPPDELLNITRNSTLIDLIERMRQQQEQQSEVVKQLTAAGKFVDNITSNPVFFVIAFCLLVIMIIVITQMTKSDTDIALTTTKNPLLYILIGLTFAGAGALIYWISVNKYAWSMIKNLYSTPVFMVTTFSLLVITVVIMFQLNKNREDNFKWFKIVIYAIIGLLAVLVIKYSNIISRFIYGIPSMTSSPWFYVIVVSLLVIIVIIISQMKKNNVSVKE